MVRVASSAWMPFACSTDTTSPSEHTSSPVSSLVVYTTRRAFVLSALICTCEQHLRKDGGDEPAVYTAPRKGEAKAGYDGALISLLRLDEPPNSLVRHGGRFCRCAGRDHR